MTYKYGKPDGTHHFVPDLMRQFGAKCYKPGQWYGEYGGIPLVAIDLKIGPFIAADKGQMDLYLAWLKKHEWRQDVENEPVGLILCTSKKRQHVELLLSSGPHKMQVSEYLTQLPSKHVLAERLKMYSRLLEQEEREA